MHLKSNISLSSRNALLKYNGASSFIPVLNEGAAKVKRELYCPFASKSFQYRCYYSTAPLFKAQPPQRSTFYKLRSLWLKWTKDPLYSMFNDENYVGCDRFGNEYYEYIDVNGLPKRLVKVKGVDLTDAYNAECFAKQMEGTKNLPMEWKSWLSFVRNDAPTKEEQERLEKERAWRAIKAREWDELQMREEIRGGSQVNTTMSGVSGKSGIEMNEAFQDYIRKERDRSQNMDQAQNYNVNSSESRWNNKDSPTDADKRNNAYGYEHMNIEDARAINEEMIRNRPVGTHEGYVPPHAETIIKPENKRTPHFFPSPSLARNYAGTFEENEEGDQFSRERNIERQLSMNKTSKFLGVRPGIRPDAMQKLKEKELAKQREAEESKSKDKNNQ